MRTVREVARDIEVGEVLEDENVELAVVDPGVLEKGDRTAVVAAVADEDEGAFAHLAVGFDEKPRRLARGDLRRGDEVAERPEVLFELPARRLHDLGVEADAGELDEVLLIGAQRDRRARVRPARMIAHASSRSPGRPSSAAKTFIVPTGRMPSATSEPAMPLTTSLTVPSPPAATIVAKAFLDGRAAATARASPGAGGHAHRAMRQFFDAPPRRFRALAAGRGIQDDEDFLHGWAGDSAFSFKARGLRCAP